MDLTFISPYDEPARVRVPPFDNEQDNSDEVVVVKEGDKDTLEHGSGRLAIEGASQRSAPRSQYRPNFEGPRLLDVALQVGPPSRNDNLAADEFPQAGLLAAATKLGLPVANIKAAIAFWGGSSLAWKTMLMTASIEAGGTDAFLFVHATGNDILFGAGSSSLRGFSLQPLLMRFRERDQQVFARIVGPEDDQWLHKALREPCEASANAFLQRMLETSGGLRHSWREKFRQLGYEPTFQHVQVEEITRLLEQAETLAAAFGMTSNQAVAYCAYVATQAGLAIITSEQQGFTQDVAAFKRQTSRKPDEQEKLLILANRVAGSLKTAAPPFSPVILGKAALLSRREGTVLERRYDLDEFGIGLEERATGVEIPVHHDKQILSELLSGWSPSQRGGKGSPQEEQFDALAEQQFVDLINRERTQRGLLPLQVDPRLADTARQHSVQMARHQTVAHELPDEAPLGTRYADRDVRTSYNGETIALRPTCLRPIMHSWAIRSTRTSCLMPTSA